MARIQLDKAVHQKWVSFYPTRLIRFPQLWRCPRALVSRAVAKQRNWCSIGSAAL